MAPGDLEAALCGLRPYRDQNVLAGFEGAEDAGVYRISDDFAIVNTVDFFTPIVDDPYVYGQIAAANALSDIYAMGAKPLTALNIVAFPKSKFDMSVLREILRGGIDKMREAEVNLIGGHSIEDDEIKYGLAVTGSVHPAKILRNSGAVRGDILILTKPLGTGILNTALKRGMLAESEMKGVQETMAALNRAACEAMAGFRVHACTDVTGFGFLGHLAELLENSKAGARIAAGEVPAFPKALEMAKADAVPGGTWKNREFRERMVDWADGIEEEQKCLLFDAQTSGGLLISVAPEDAQPLLENLRSRGVPCASRVGEITDEACRIRVG